jgi:aminoglycoside phosphotransferase (APT) family kinase protein
VRQSAGEAVLACLERVGVGPCRDATLVARRDNSRVHRVACGSRVIAVKECLRADGALDADAATREFDALTRLLDASTRASAPPLAPLPLALCPEHAAYAMTWAEGRCATDVILDRATTRAEAVAVGEAAGEWLRRFHMLQAGPARAHDFASRAAYLAGLADTVPRDRLIRRAAAALARAAPAASAVQMPQSWVHGDMKSDNLIVAPPCATGLDFQLADRNSVVYDLAPFINHLALLKGSPRGALRRDNLAATGAAFLRIYSPDAARWELPMLWLRGYLLAQRVAAPESRGRLRAAAARWTAGRELARVLALLEGR